MNTPANVTIVALFALLLQACDVPTLRQYDFSDTPEDVVSEAFQLYAIGPRAIDKAAFSEHINTRMKLHESDLLGYFKKNHLTCELNGPNFTCKHNRRSPRMHCDQFNHVRDFHQTQPRSH
jgi:hypothetical protein